MGIVARFDCEKCKSESYGIKPVRVHILDSLFEMCDECAKELEWIAAHWMNNNPYCNCPGFGTVRENA